MNQQDQQGCVSIATIKSEMTDELDSNFDELADDASVVSDNRQTPDLTLVVPGDVHARDNNLDTQNLPCVPDNVHAQDPSIRSGNVYVQDKEQPRVKQTAVPAFTCLIDDCHKPHTDEKSRNRHMGASHFQGHYLCPHPSCSVRFHRGERLVSHVRAKHPYEEISFTKKNRYGKIDTKRCKLSDEPWLIPNAVERIRWSELARESSKTAHDIRVYFAEKAEMDIEAAIVNLEDDLRREECV
ncbi:hypothetical protein AcW1_008444 [Taiwanofungus camphoratus]|nr:hypothetical protein AcW1_008444 [Antrodia cinnamomea]